MFYEEIIIEGVLHFRLTPKGTWIKMTEKRLTKEIERLKAENEKLKLLLEQIQESGRLAFLN